MVNGMMVVQKILTGLKNLLPKNALFKIIRYFVYEYKKILTIFI